MTGSEHTIGDPAELAALYLAGAMTDHEQAAFEAHLSAGCAACDREMLALDPLFAALGNSSEAVVPSARRGSRPWPARTISWASCLRNRSKESWRLRPRSRGNCPSFCMRSQNWHSISIEGVLLQKLGIDHAERRIAALVRMAPGSSLPAHTHDEGEQCVVLHGELAIGDHCIVAASTAIGSPAKRSRIRPLNTAACSWSAARWIRRVPAIHFHAEGKQTRPQSGSGLPRVSGASQTSPMPTK